MKTVTVSVLVAITCLSLSAWGQSRDPLDDEFSALDRQLEAQFEQQDKILEKQFLQVKRAIDSAYKGLSKKISVNWQQDIELPTAYSWTTYDDTYASRATFDFAQGLYQIETIVEQDVAKSLLLLKAFATQIAQSSQTELLQADVFNQALQNELQHNEVRHSELVYSGLSAATYVHVDAILAANTVDLIAQVELVTPTTSGEAKEFLSQAKSTKPQQLSPKVDPAETQMRAAESEDKKPQVALAIETKDAVKRLVLTIPFINTYQKNLLQNKLELVKSLANQYQLDVSLILAVIETESAFNPMAISPVPAFGLMQLVPNTAGIDAYEFLYGQRKVVSPEYLFDPSNNLTLGAAYLHLLSSRYLRDINNEQSKLLCMLASYNTGIGNLARTFIQQKSVRLAVIKINSLAPEQIYTHLMENLPAQETKNYLKKVLSRKQRYASFD
jgi:membrane-bound lytic murein transglycosylase C